MEEQGASGSNTRKFSADTLSEDWETELLSEDDTTGSDTEREDIYLWTALVDALSDMVCKEFGAHLPDAYKDFLVLYDPKMIDSLELAPFSVFSFQTDKRAVSVKDSALKKKPSDLIDIQYELRAASALLNYVVAERPWFIALREIHDVHDNTVVILTEYYFINLEDKHDTSIHKLDRHERVTSIHKRLNEFVAFCAEESKNIRRSLEKDRNAKV